MLQEHQHVRKFIHQDELLRTVARTSIIAVLGLLLLGATLSVSVRGTQALGVCSGSDHTYGMVRGDPLSRIANRYGTDWSELASYNRITNSNLIEGNQRNCIPGTEFGGDSSVSRGPITRSVTSISAQISLTSTSTVAMAKGGNQFPYPACTWWANERYRQLHGIYVPWRTKANAWQWTARAYDFGWHVSRRPSVGSIIDLQPWVQGAYGQGHVGVVERVLSNGHVIASSTSWGSKPYVVSYIEFAPGGGVTFIRQ